MEPDIHVRAASGATKYVPADGRLGGHGLYLAMCGEHVRHQFISYKWPNSPVRHPTCMGCILVNLSNRAEDGI